MALRALIIGKKLTEARGRLEKLREKDEEFQTREAELEEAISEAESEEDQEAVEKLVEEFETEKEAHEEEKKKLEEEISDMESTLLYEDRSNRSFAFIQLSLDHKTSCCAVRVCFQFRNLCC